MDPIHRRRLSLSLLAVGLLAVGSCDSTTEPGADDEPPPEAQTCEWISLSSSASAIPTAPVELGVVPDSFASPTWVEVRAPDDTTAGHTWMQLDDERAATMVAPVHPLGDPDGGAVELTVTDGARTCAPVDFTVEALPEAPGTLAAVADSLAAMVEVQAEILGTTADSLATASFDTLEPELFPLAIGQAVISHGANANSLMAIAAGASAEFGDFDRALADRLIARAGFPDAINAYLTRLRAVAASVPSSSDPGSGGAIAAQSDNPADYNCIGITTAFELDFCMSEAADAASALQGATGTVLKDMGAATGVAGLVPHKGVQAGAAALGAGIWATTTYFEAWSGLLPSQLADLTFELTKESFLEDEEGSGEWQNALITATSTGWGADKAILEAIVQATGVAGPFKQLADKLGDGPELGLDELLEFILTDRVNAAIKAATGGDDLIDYPPKTFGPVPVDSAQWTESEVDALGVIELTDRTTYEPRKPGTGYVIVQNVAGTFADQTLRTNEPVEVERILVDIQPSAEQADPGQVIAFDATVTNAAHPELLDVAAHLGQIINVTYEGSGLHTIEYAAPDEVEFEDFITAWDTASTGARAYSTEPRADQATVSSDVQVRVRPAGACLPSDQTITFTADVIGHDSASIAWDVVEGTGTIDAGGTFTPDQTGTVTVRAALQSDSTIQGTATIDVGGCDCWWAVNVSGIPLYGTRNLTNPSDGSQLAHYGVDDGLLAFIAGQGETTGGERGDFNLDFAPQPPLAPGDYVAYARGELESALAAFVTNTEGSETLPPNLPVDVTLEKADTTGLEGSASGYVTVGDVNGAFIGTFWAGFRIEAEENSGTEPNLYMCGRVQ